MKNERKKIRDYRFIIIIVVFLRWLFINYVKEEKTKGI
jgi:hypothetical protein